MQELYLCECTCPEGTFRRSQTCPYRWLAPLGLLLPVLAVVCYTHRGVVYLGLWRFFALSLLQLFSMDPFYINVLLQFLSPVKLSFTHGIVLNCVVRGIHLKVMAMKWHRLCRIIIVPYCDFEAKFTKHGADLWHVFYRYKLKYSVNVKWVFQ